MRDVLAHRVLQAVVVRQRGARAQPHLLDGAALGRPVLQALFHHQPGGGGGDLRLQGVHSGDSAWTGLPPGPTVACHHLPGDRHAEHHDDHPLSLNHLLERAGHLFQRNEIVSRLPDKSLRRHSYGEFYRRTRSLASALQKLGLKKGDRVATCAGTTTRTWSATSASRPRAA